MGLFSASNATGPPTIRRSRLATATACARTSWRVGMALSPHLVDRLVQRSGEAGGILRQVITARLAELKANGGTVHHAGYSGTCKTERPASGARAPVSTARTCPPPHKLAMGRRALLKAKSGLIRPARRSPGQAHSLSSRQLAASPSATRSGSATLPTTSTSCSSRSAPTSLTRPNNVVHCRTPIAEALLGAEEGDEVEILVRSYLKPAVLEKIVGRVHWSSCHATDRQRAVRGDNP